MDTTTEMLRAEIRALQERDHKLSSQLQSVILKQEIMMEKWRGGEMDIEKIGKEHEKTREHLAKIDLQVNSLMVKMGFVVVIAIFFAESFWKMFGK